MFKHFIAAICIVATILGTPVHAIGVIASSRTHIAAQNLFLWSEDLTHAPWTHTALATVTANAAVAPDGTTTATQIQLAAGAPFSESYVEGDAGSPSAGTYCASICLKGTASQKVNLVLWSYPGTNALNQVTFTGEWQRMQVSVVHTAGRTIYFDIETLGYVGASTLPAVTFYAWGAQCNTTENMKPYVKTTSATVP